MVSIVQGKLTVPAKVGVHFLDVDNEKYKKIILETGDEQGKNTNLKCDMTNWHLNQTYPELNELAEKIILEGVIPYLTKVYTNENYNAEEDVKSHNFLLADMWGAVYNKNDYANKHSHGLAHTSFCYYVEAPTNCPLLVFDDAEVAIQPETGMLVLFSADLFHSVPASVIDEQRIVIAGNVDLVPGNVALNKQ
jgi:hypothetical protein